MKHYGDIRAMRGADLPPVDCVIGGSPCQDLSIAGSRAGLAGDRSGLLFEQIRIIRELREEDRKRGRAGSAIRPRIAVWENVPGAFSSGKPAGEDFRIVLEAFARIADPTADVPRPSGGKWKPSGIILGSGFSIAWRVLDAQFWGVPQRRRRIALVADLGGSAAPEILSERESLPRNITPGRAEGEEAAGDSGAGAVRTDRTDGPYRLIWPEIANTLTQRHDSSPMPGQLQRICTAPYDTTQITSQTNASNPAPGAPCHTLSAKSHTPLIVAAGFNGHRTAGAEIEYAEERAPSLAASMPSNVATGTPAICLQDNGIDRSENAGCCGAGWRDDDTSHTLNTTDRHAVMCAASGQANAEILDELCPSLNCDHEQPICFDARGNGDGKTAPPLAGDHGNRVTDYTAIVQTSIVRRLTPLECERLQGYPDGWTDITWTPPHRKTPERAKDSSRYKALGNSIALPPWAWVCGRIREQYNRPITLGSLFDGIGGFPLVWERINGKGTALWASEIEPFCVAVTAQRFEKNKCAKKQNALLGMNESEGTP